MWKFNIEFFKNFLLAEYISYWEIAVRRESLDKMTTKQIKKEFKN